VACLCFELGGKRGLLVMSLDFGIYSLFVCAKLEKEAQEEIVTGGLVL
jgi:hypothetical protein